MATYTSNYGWTKPSGSDNVDISVLNDNLDDQDSTIHDAFLNMAPPFSESSTYAVDDIVLYTTGLYKCHTAVVTPGSWTGSTNWQVYKLSEGGSGGGGTSDYSALNNKPQINSVELKGNKSLSDLGIQSELTFDNTPTDGSNNPVKSDGIYDSEKDIYAVMGQMGAKNLLAESAISTEINGVTFTVNDDGTISTSGTSTSDFSTYIIGTANLKVGQKYIISGSEADTTNKYYIRIRGANDTSENYYNITEPVEFTAGQSLYNVNLRIYNNINMNGIKLYPMIRLASDTDPTYQPYAKTNKQLTDDVSSILTEQDSIETELDTKADKTATASGETLALVPTSEGKALIHTAYGMSVQNGTPTPSSPVDIVSATANFTSTHGQDSATVITDLTLRAIEVTSSDDYNLVRDGKYYIADTLDYSEDNGFVVTRRIGALTFDGSDDTNFTIASNYVSSDKRLIYNNAIIPSYQNLGYSNAWHKGSINSNFLPECIASANQPYNSVETIGLHLSNHNIQLYIAGKSSVADYMAAFVSNPLNVIYRLATPTTETITTEQALALLGLKTYDESTTISSQAEPSCTIAVEYAKERLGALALTAYNTAKGNDLRITALES